MMEVTSNFNWSKRQIEAYARAFESGDAAFENGVKWREVCTKKMIEIGEKSGVIHDGEGNWFEVVPLTVKHVETEQVKRGDKLIWLAESQRGKTFGKVYKVRSGERGAFIVDDLNSGEILHVPHCEEIGWGFIPLYENVNERDKMHEKASREMRGVEHEALDFLMEFGDEAKVRFELLSGLKLSAKKSLELDEYNKVRSALKMIEELSKGII